jgi:hypothetical protein
LFFFFLFFELVCFLQRFEVDAEEAGAEAEFQEAAPLVGKNIDRSSMISNSSKMELRTSVKEETRTKEEQEEEEEEEKEKEKGSENKNAKDKDNEKEKEEDVEVEMSVVRSDSLIADLPSRSPRRSVPHGDVAPVEQFVPQRSPRSQRVDSKTPLVGKITPLANKSVSPRPSLIPDDLMAKSPSSLALLRPRAPTSFFVVSPMSRRSHAELQLQLEKSERESSDSEFE